MRQSMSRQGIICRRLVHHHRHRGMRNRHHRDPEGAAPAERDGGSEGPSAPADRIRRTDKIASATAERVGGARKITTAPGGVGGAKRSVHSTGRSRRPKVVGAPPLLECVRGSGPLRFTPRELGASDGTPIAGISAVRSGPFQPFRTAQSPRGFRVWRDWQRRDRSLSAAAQRCGSRSAVASRASIGGDSRTGGTDSSIPNRCGEPLGTQCRSRANTHGLPQLAVETLVADEPPAGSAVMSIGFAMMLVVKVMVPVDPVEVMQDEEPRKGNPRVKEGIGHPVIVAQVRRGGRVVRQNGGFATIIIVADGRRRLSVGSFTRGRLTARRRGLGIGRSTRRIHGQPQVQGKTVERRQSFVPGYRKPSGLGAVDHRLPQFSHDERSHRVVGKPAVARRNTPLSQKALGFDLVADDAESQGFSQGEGKIPAAQKGRGCRGKLGVWLRLGRHSGGAEHQDKTHYHKGNQQPGHALLLVSSWPPPFRNLLKCNHFLKNYHGLTPPDAFCAGGVGGFSRNLQEAPPAHFASGLSGPPSARRMAGDSRAFKCRRGKQP